MLSTKGQDPLHFFQPPFFPSPKFWNYKCNDVHLVGLIVFCTLQNFSNGEGKWEDKMKRILTRLQKLQILLFEFVLTPRL